MNRDELPEEKSAGRLEELLQEGVVRAHAYDVAELEAELAVQQILQVRTFFRELAKL